MIIWGAIWGAILGIILPRHEDAWTLIAGGLIGALIGWSMPEERVKEYEEGIRQGGILMGVHARSDEDARYLEDQWRANRGERIYR